jgi:hypothetical protein
MLKLAVLAASAVFNVGVINPDTQLIESYLACEVDYYTAVAIVAAEQPHHPHKMLGIFDDTARVAAEVDSHTTSRACLTSVNAQS